MVTPADLAGLVPPFVHLAVAPLGEHAGPPPCPFPEEAGAVARAVATRRREFLWGRACARAALGALGVAPVPIGVGPRRQPLWPAGVVGSIAHGGGWAVAAVASEVDALGVGIDVEPLEPPLEPAVEALVHGGHERAAFAAGPEGLAKVAFCAKECVYKCVYPWTGRAPGFRDATVEVDAGAGAFTAALAGPPGPGVGPAAPLRGRYLVVEGLVVAAVVVARPPQGVMRSAPR